MFQCKRHIDNAHLVLKHCQYKNEKEKKMYLEEITALQMLEDNDLIINFYEAYDYQERLWIFLE